MESSDIKLTSPEISALWTTYNECSATTCVYQHFLQHLKDENIKAVIEEAQSLNDTLMIKIQEILTAEKFPIPKAFSDDDVNLSAPALYSDLYALSFVYREGRMLNIFYSTMLGKVVRKDIYTFIEQSLYSSIKIFEKSIKLMLDKGIYDRPPKIAYPKHVTFVHEEPSLMENWFGESRPLNVLELGEIFFVIERNSIGLELITGLLQVAKDSKVKEYLKKGKTLSEKQIKAFNDILKDSEEPQVYPMTMEVTDSTVSPFSDRLIMFFIGSANKLGLTTLSYALSVSTRKDLGVQYSKFIAEILKFGNEGLKLMIEKGWMEQPPQSANRKQLYKE